MRQALLEPTPQRATNSRQATTLLLFVVVVLVDVLFVVVCLLSFGCCCLFVVVCLQLFVCCCVFAVAVPDCNITDSPQGAHGFEQAVGFPVGVSLSDCCCLLLVSE